MKVSKHCYMIPGLGYLPPWTVNSGFIVGEKVTLVADSGPNAWVAETIYGYAHGIKESNSMILINLEKHLDHVGGNSLFTEKGVSIYGHHLINRNAWDFENEKKDFNAAILNTERKHLHEENLIFLSSKIKNPDIAIDKEFEMDLGNLIVQVILTPGHTETNISLFVPEDKVLYTADCIVNGYIPNMDEGDEKMWLSWKQSLEKLRKVGTNKIIPGHGRVIEGEGVIKAFDEMERHSDKKLNGRREPF